MKYIQKHYSLKLQGYIPEGITNNAYQYWIQNITLPYKFVGPCMIVHVHNGRFPANKCMHKTYPSCNTTNKIPVHWSFKMHCIAVDYSVISLIALWQNVEMHVV